MVVGRSDQVYARHQVIVSRPAHRNNSFLHRDETSIETGDFLNINDEGIMDTTKMFVRDIIGDIFKCRVNFEGPRISYDADMI